MDNIKELFKLRGDKGIWLFVLFIAMFSILAVYSSTKSLAFRSPTGNSVEYLAFKHAMFLFIGLGLTFFAHKIDYNNYSWVAKYLLYLCFPLLLGTLIFGKDGRWISILGNQFQPSEIAKFVLIIYLARVISKNQNTIKTFKDGLLPILLPVLGICSLIILADFSTAMLILITSFIMMIVGRVNFKYIFGLFTLGMITITIFFTWLLKAPDSLLIGRQDVWKNRIVSYKDNFFSDNKDNLDQQEKFANIAIAHGGIIGKGAGKGLQKNFIPEAYSDFIFAVIAEEYGFLGALIVICLYLYFFYRCIFIFTKSEGTFGGLLAISLALSLVIQAMLNICVTVGLLPVTGVTLPLISRGGTSILITCLAIGVILSVDHYTEVNSGDGGPKKRKPSVKKKKVVKTKAKEEPKDISDEPIKKQRKLGGLDFGRA